MERYIGKMLDNRYEILEVIGTGGMAVVFKARCHRLNRLVAIKMLKKDLSEDAEFRRRFHDESQAVAMLSHPNIMAVYDVSRGGDMDYIVMELIDGITLKQYMERRGRLNWPEALHFITQIMKGLSHAHSRGIIHRDIKPQNIMILRDGTVKVTDFGIACLTNGANPTNEAIGSVHYISPEQAKGDYTDNRSDIYSAGVVLYEMLTSRLPFDGDNPVSIAIQHFSAVPLPPRELNPDIPEALEQICLKAMACDRNKRYSTADEMLADLEAFRKDPTLSFDYTPADLPVEQSGEDEPTQYLPNVGVTRTRPQPPYHPVQEPEEDEEEERPRSNWWKILLMIIAIAVVGYFAVTTLFSFVMESLTPVTVDYKVPSVLGYTVEEAEKLEGVAGIFEIKQVDTANSSEYDKGEIIDQNPKEGETKRGGVDTKLTIEVTVSLGAKSGTMLNVVDVEARSAKLILEQNTELSKLDLDIVEGTAEYSDTIKAGNVIRTIPAANETLGEGDTVTLIVSLGPKIKMVPMPPCVGQDIATVQQMMNQAGLVASFTPVEGSEPEGQVLTQSVDTGEEVAEGTTVTFTYSNGEKELSQVVTYEIPYSPTEVNVAVYLDSTEVLKTNLPGDFGTLELTLTAKAGEYRLRIYVNDLLQEERTVVFSE